MLGIFGKNFPTTVVAVIATVTTGTALSKTAVQLIPFLQTNSRGVLEAKFVPTPTLPAPTVTDQPNSINNDSSSNSGGNYRSEPYVAPASVDATTPVVPTEDPTSAPTPSPTPDPTRTYEDRSDDGGHTIVPTGGGTRNSGGDD